MTVVVETSVRMCRRHTRWWWIWRQDIIRLLHSIVDKSHNGLLPCLTNIFIEHAPVVFFFFFKKNQHSWLEVIRISEWLNLKVWLPIGATHNWKCRVFQLRVTALPSMSRRNWSSDFELRLLTIDIRKWKWSITSTHGNLILLHSLACYVEVKVGNTLGVWGEGVLYLTAFSSPVPLPFSLQLAWSLFDFKINICELVQTKGGDTMERPTGTVLVFQNISGIPWYTKIVIVCKNTIVDKIWSTNHLVKTFVWAFLATSLNQLGIITLGRPKVATFRTIAEGCILRIRAKKVQNWNRNLVQAKPRKNEAKHTFSQEKRFLSI